MQDNLIEKVEIPKYLKLFKMMRSQ